VRVLMLPESLALAADDIHTGLAAAREAPHEAVLADTTDRGRRPWHRRPHRAIQGA